MNNAFKKSNPPWQEYFQECQQSAQDWIAHSGSAPVLDSRASLALQVALSNPGKLFRSQLVLGLAHLFGQAGDTYIHRIAAAVEMVHTASLILDDLPCMDDARLRRGQAPIHLQFGESHAILAAFAIISRANQLLSHPQAMSGHARQLQVIAAFNRSFDLDGLAGGQSLDLEVDASTPIPEFATIHHHKTGALFLACAEMVAAWCQIPPLQEQKITAFARTLGLAFQVADDLLDLRGSEETQKHNVSNLHSASLSQRLPKDELMAQFKAHHLAAKKALTCFGPSANPLHYQLEGLLSLAESLPCSTSS